MRGWAGLIGVCLPFFLLFVAACGPSGGRKLWGISLVVSAFSWLCFFVLTASFYADRASEGAVVISPLSLVGGPWSEEWSLQWDFLGVVLSLGASSVVVCFHFLAKDILSGSRASIAGLGAYLGCLLGALGAGNLFLFSIFFVGSLVPRFIFTGVDGRDKTIDTIKETAFLTIVASFSLLVVVLVFSAPFRDTLGEWFQFSTATHQVPAGNIGFFLLLFAAAVGAGFFPFHGNARRAYELETIERAVPLALQPLFGFAILFRFCPEMFFPQLQAYSPYLTGLFAVGLVYSAVNFLGSVKARDRVFWLQAITSCLVATGFFSLNRKGWHGAYALLLFQSLVIPFFLIVISFHERRSEFLPHRLAHFPALAISTVSAVLFALFLPVSVGFYGVLLVVWALVDSPGWYFPLVVVSVPIIALAGMSSMFFQLGEKERQGSATGDLTFEEICSILPIGLMLLVMGLVPKVLMGPMGASVAGILRSLGISE